MGGACPSFLVTFIDSLSHDLYEPTVSNRQSNFVVVLDGMEDVCCIVGNAALGEILATAKYVGAHNYFKLLAVSI